MRPSLNNREGLLAVGDGYHSDQKSSMIFAAKQVRHYIGTIEIPGIARGTACLLEDGKILTCLHNILDYNALDDRRAELIDFEKSNASVYFVKDDEIFKYKINAVPISGIDHLRANQLSSWCFDYAFLETEGDPVSDLGGGFKLDETNHFGSAFVSDPAQTLAISGPFIKMTEDGNLKAHRYVSLSENQAAEGGFYHITQAGDHPSAPGFSGMAMVPIDRNYSIDTLYAIHSYRDNQGQQTGAKISEIISSISGNVSVTSTTLDPSVVEIIKRWYERLTTAKRNMDGSITRGKDEVSFDEAVKILQRGGDIAGDNKKEVTGPANKAWGKTITDEPHQPLGWPHLHHHQRASSGHAFFPGEVQRKEMVTKERMAKLEGERRQKQIADSKAKKAESKADQIQKEREDKDKKPDGRF